MITRGVVECGVFNPRTVSLPVSFQEWLRRGALPRSTTWTRSLRTRRVTALAPRWSIAPPCASVRVPHACTRREFACIIKPHKPCPHASSRPPPMLTGGERAGGQKRAEDMMEAQMSRLQERSKQVAKCRACAARFTQHRPSAARAMLHGGRTITRSHAGLSADGCECRIDAAG